MRKQNRRFLLMGFGLGGNHGDGIDRDGNVFSSSWYLTPDNLQEHIDRGSYSAAELEGCILINKIPVVEANPAVVFDSPMVDVRLKGEETMRITSVLSHPASQIVLAGIAETQPTIGFMATRALLDPNYVGLDRLSPPAYVAWWRAHGAPIGCVKKGKVIWEPATHVAGPAAVGQATGAFVPTEDS